MAKQCDDTGERRPGFGRGIGLYLVATAVSLGALAWTMELWRADIRVPFGYSRGGDLLFYSTIIKGTIDHGWLLHNPDIGMPTGLFLHDFPNQCNLVVLLIKALSLVSQQPGVVLNLYFIATFPLTAVISLWALRILGTSRPLALSGGLLYAFLPFHFMRGVSHLFVGAYFLVPLAIVVAVWLARGDVVPLAERKMFGWWHSKCIGAFLICVVVSSASAYHSFFAAFLFLVSGLVAYFRFGSLRLLLTPVVLSAVLIGGLLVNLLPNLIFMHQNGRSYIAERSVGDVEVLGMKIAQLILPAPGHKSYRLRSMRKAYDESSPPLLRNENGSSSLGAIGSIGFLLLLGRLLGARLSVKNPGDLRIVSRLNLAAILLATTGGFSSLVAMYLSPQIRAYNRISVFVAFFALLAFMWALDGFFRKRIKSSAWRIRVSWAAAVLVTAAGIVDQAAPGIAVPPYGKDRARYKVENTFVEQLESALPNGAMIFQLPYAAFPEGSLWTERMLVYDHFRVYLHSESLRWSYGAMYGRETDFWQQTLSRSPVDDMVQELVEAGFAGIYIDTFGFRDSGEELVRQLRRRVARDPVVSKDRRMMFFDLGGLSQTNLQ